MPNIVLHTSGVKAALSNGNVSGGGLRGEVGGWSTGSARRCDLFLRSVVYERLKDRGLVGYALTLTLSVCPTDFSQWTAARKSFFERLRRTGMSLLHHVTEWQMRGRFSNHPVPHLHCVVFFEEGVEPEWRSGICSAFGSDALKVHWLEVADHFDPLAVGQHCELINDIKGWFRYLSKHASRSVQHYQRSFGVMPKGWQKTGRMWGKSGDWPVFELTGKISTAVFFKLRRFCNRYQIAEARAAVVRQRERGRRHTGSAFIDDIQKLLALSVKRHKHLRRSLVRNDRFIARIVPLSEWVPASVIQTWLDQNCELIEREHPETGELIKHWFDVGELNHDGLAMKAFNGVLERGPQVV